VPALRDLLDRHAPGCERIVAMLRSGVDTPAPARSVAEGIAFARRLFDWSVGQHAETSVALYSLGSPEILARATAEVIDVLDGWGVLGPSVRALEIGCGIGRLLLPLAERTQAILGIDVAPRMVEVARERCAHDPRIEVRHCTGADLLGIADRSLELVLAVDCFPYVVQAGSALVDAYVAEVRRVLVPGGQFALLNYSYRGDPQRDRADVTALAARHDLTLRVAGTQPFKLWNALAFLLQA
jgi:SAM-dependent methyltransferase